MSQRCTALFPAFVLLTTLTACGARDDGDDPIVEPDASIEPSPDAGPPAQGVVACSQPIAPPTTGFCGLDSTSGSGPSVLIRGDVLGAGTVFENGSVLIDGAGVISCVGCDCADASARIVNCPGAAISPGLINPHDHLTFTEGWPIDHGTTRWVHRHGWRAELSAPQNPHGTGASSAGNRWGEIRMTMGGNTTLVGSGHANGMLRNLDRGTTAQLGLDLPSVEFQTFPLGDANRQFHEDCQWNYRDTEDEVAGFSAYLPHVAEGIDENAADEFRCQSRSFDGGRDFTEPNTAHIHSIGLTASDYLRMATDSAKIIWSPRSNIDLYGVTADVALFAQLGGVVAIGTDWTYSGSIHSVRELHCADAFNSEYLDNYFSDEDLWKMATINAAIALAADSKIGSLEVGKVGDIAVYNGAPGAHHRAVLAANTTDVLLVLRGGTPLFGESDVVSGLGEACETLDMCGESRALCAAREFDGATYSQIASEVTGSYPAFFCDTPTDEPSCTPFRPGEFTGAKTGTDADGDGIDDPVDNCPTVFNPIRPIDNGDQPDADGDGTGDACDLSPLPSDLDADSVANDVDNCPWDSNANQSDGDSDSRGDVCDPCPSLSNPTGPCPPADAKIADIQMGLLQVGQNVTVRGVVVTAVSGNGIAVQDPSAGPDYAGIMVFIGDTPTAAIGDQVDISGAVNEYFDNSEITATSVTVTGSATPIVPAEVTAAVAATEAYEGVLVRVTDASVSDADYDCSVDGPCSDNELWEINGEILVYDRFYQDDDSWASHNGEVPVAGVMMYRFDRRRLMPRDRDDFGSP